MSLFVPHVCGNMRPVCDRLHFAWLKTGSGLENANYFGRKELTECVLHCCGVAKSENELWSWDTFFFFKVGRLLTCTTFKWDASKDASTTARHASSHVYIEEQCLCSIFKKTFFHSTACISQSWLSYCEHFTSTKIPNLLKWVSVAQFVERN